MEYGIGRTPHPLGLDHSRRRPEQRQELGGPISDILMRLPGRLSFQFPALAGIGDGLIGACLILAAQGNPRRFCLPVRPLDHPLFSSVSGSTTVTTPLLRTRCAVPVGHQLLVFWYELPASSKTRLTVLAPICSSPSLRNRFWSVDNDQVAVPSFFRSGGVCAVATICARAVAP